MAPVKPPPSGATSFQMLAEHATDLISCHEPRGGRFTYLSPACRRLLQREPESLIGQRPRDLVHPDDRQAVIDARPRVLSGGGATVTLRYRMRRADGRHLWVESNCHVPPGRPRGDLVVITRDVEAQVRAAQRLHLFETAVEHMRDGVVMTEQPAADGNAAPVPWQTMRVVYRNPVFTDLCGPVGSEPTLAQIGLVGPHLDPRTRDRLQDAVDRRTACTLELTHHGRDGETPMELALNPLPDGADAVRRWVWILRDLNPHRRRQQQEHEHRDALAHAARLASLGQLTSGLAHELNQPLGAITAYAGGALDRLAHDPHGVEEALHKIAFQAARGGRIVRHLRNFVQKRPVPHTAVSLRHMVADALRLARSITRVQPITLTLHPPDEMDGADTEPQVFADPIQLEQVVLNLIQNAADAVAGQPDGQRRVDLYIRRNARQQTATVRVVDSGPPLSPGTLDRLFQPFWTTKAEGLGLGLNICQTIAEAHGGTLTARHNEPGGLVVSLTLPLQGRERPAPPEAL